MSLTGGSNWCAQHRNVPSKAKMLGYVMMWLGPDCVPLHLCTPIACPQLHVARPTRNANVRSSKSEAIDSTPDVSLQ